MADSRQQVYSFIDQSITDPLNQQNTAGVVRAVLKYIVQHSANLADDGGLFNTPEGVTWLVKPTLQVSGNTLTVSEAEAEWAGVTVLYPETSFTLATPAEALERMDTVYANQNGTYGVDAGPEGESAVAEQPPVGTLLAGFVLVGAAGGQVQPVSSAEDVAPVPLTDAVTVTYNTYQNGKVRPNAELTLAATPLLQTLVIANTQIGYAYQVRIKNCSGQQVTISPVSGVSYKQVDGTVLTTVTLPDSGDCILSYYHASSSERVIEVLAGEAAGGGNFIPLSNPQSVATTLAATLNPGEMELLTQFASGKRAYLYGLEATSMVIANSPALANAVASALYASDMTRDITAAVVVADGMPVFRISMFDIALQQTTYFDFGFDGKLYVNGVEFAGGGSPFDPSTYTEQTTGQSTTKWMSQKAVSDELTDIQGQIDRIVIGEEVYLLDAAPYPVEAYTSAYAATSVNFVQTETADGLLMEQKYTSSQLQYLNTGIAWNDTKKTTLKAVVSNIGSDPAIGLCWGVSTNELKGIFYRKSGQMFEISVSNGTGSITTIRNATTSLAFVNGDEVKIEINPVAGTVTTSLNGVAASSIIFTDSPTDNIKIGFRGGLLNAVATIEEMDAVGVSEMKGSEIVYYVNGSTGNDGNSGKVKGSPFKTINKALSKVANKTANIYVKGLCRENFDNIYGLDFKKITGKVRLIGEQTEGAKVLFSEKLVFTKTSGYTNVYEAPFTGTIPIPGVKAKRIFEDGKPSKAILAGEQHPLHKGLTNRLPYTEITELALVTDLSTTLTQLDGLPGRYYQDTTTNKIYVHTSNSSSPLTNGYSYEVPKLKCSNTPDLTNTGQLEIHNIGFYYANGNGLNCGNFQQVIRKNVQVFGASGEGFDDDVAYVESWNDEAAGCGNDGVSGHYDIASNWNTSDLRFGHNLAIYRNQWSHDNGGDGNSHHERGFVFSYNCLYEYNSKSGIAPASGCMWTDNHSLMRYNKGTAGRGEGVEVINAIADGRANTLFMGFGTICEYNRIGFGAYVSASNGLILNRCISRNNDVAEYNADYGFIKANNCMGTNSDPLKLKVVANGGTITVQNDTLLT